MKKLLLLIIPLGLSIAAAIIINISSTVPADTGGSVKAVSSLPTVIIDPGHGGFDGGASTNDGVPEKNINLKISLYLNDCLKIMGIETVLVRTDDCSVEDDGLTTIKSRKTSDILNRMKLMENTDNSIFISIHQNHFSQNKYNGTQVFYSANFSEQSSLIAESIQETVVSKLQPTNTRQIKKCGTSVYLMYNAVKPAVLVECGFLSNSNEAKLLQTEEYQKKMAFCIAVGILNYLTSDKE